eukprot:scaffold39562_cov19-Tisochrysis_lutea.AAC.1
MKGHFDYTYIKGVNPSDASSDTLTLLLQLIFVLHPSSDAPCCCRFFTCNPTHSLLVSLNIGRASGVGTLERSQLVKPRIGIARVECADK